jgi:hypothetical protein
MLRIPGKHAGGLSAFARTGSRGGGGLRNCDGTIEVHIVSFDSDQNLQRFRGDPRRAWFAHLIEASAAKNEFLAMTDIT